MLVKLYTDGGARGNPGPAGIGVHISDSRGKAIKEISEYIGKATNNQAEYKALIRGLRQAKKLGADEISVIMDSELVVKQITGEYRVKNSGLAALFEQARDLLGGFKKWSVSFVKRDKNKKADALVNRALDEQE